MDEEDLSTSDDDDDDDTFTTVTDMSDFGESLYEGDDDLASDVVDVSENNSGEQNIHFPTFSIATKLLDGLIIEVVSRMNA